jgi:hypothetical protein
MALFEELFEEGVGGPLAIGIGALILAPKLLPVVGRALRPVAKEAIKAGITIYEGTCATFSEATGDLIAEVRAERESESRRGRETQQGAEAVR